MSSICQNCGLSVPAHEQMYRVDDSVVCVTCADVAPADPELAAAAAQARRGPGTRKRASSGLRLGVFAFVAVMLGVAGGVGYMVYSGKLAETVVQHRDAINGASTTNAVISRYNALIADANALATQRKYAEAADTFREARAVASALPDVAKDIDVAQIDSIITHYEALAAGRVPRNVEVRTVRVHAPAAQPSVDTTVTDGPAEPHIGFMEKGVVAPEPVTAETPDDPGTVTDAPQTAPARTRTEAYVAPKR